jgi:hypothetical protein
MPFFCALRGAPLLNPWVECHGGVGLSLTAAASTGGRAMAYAIRLAE